MSTEITSNNVMRYNYLCGGATKKCVLLHNNRRYCGTNMVPSMVPLYVPLAGSEDKKAWVFLEYSFNQKPEEHYPL